ncbi:hypothetical protein MBBA_1393 [Methanoculleus bourgensis]|nr:hypothetical protein MBBA_1393 [Methanoculleus bourgensis]
MLRWVGNADCPPAHPGRGPWWASPWGVGTGEGARPLPAQGGGTAKPPPRPACGLLPRPKAAGAVWRYPGKNLSGHDELLVRTGRARTDCPPTRFTTVFRGGGRLTADRPIVPQTDVHLLNWTVSSRVSIPNVSAYGADPLPSSPPPVVIATTVHRLEPGARKTRSAGPPLTTQSCSALFRVWRGTAGDTPRPARTFPQARWR